MSIFDFRGGKGRFGRPLVELDYAMTANNAPVPMVTFPGAASEEEIAFVRGWVEAACAHAPNRVFFPDYAGQPHPGGMFRSHVRRWAAWMRGRDV